MIQPDPFSRYHTILFDFDGTLVPSLESWLESFQYALGQYNRTLPEDVIITRCFYRDYHETAAEFGLPSGTELQHHVLTGLSRALVTTRLFPQVPELLNGCLKAGFKLGLVTSSPRLLVMATLDRLGIGELFGAVVTADEVTHFKPHPEPVQHALRLLDADPSGALFVGDYSVDILAGRSAQTETALFLPESHRRFYDFDHLRSTEPHFVFTHHAELIAYLGL